MIEKMSRVEMAEYLLLPDKELSDSISKAVDTAVELSSKYDFDDYGVALVGDFMSSPHFLEDLEEGEELVKVFEKNGIVLYRKPHKQKEELKRFRVLVMIEHTSEIFALNETEAMDIAENVTEGEMTVHSVCVLD